MIQDYFDRISSSLAASSWVKSSHLIRYDVTEIDENEILIYSFKIALSDGGLLELSERVVFSKITGTYDITTYRFHWQNSIGSLVKRWDNAPHHPEIATHPHHVHVGQANKIMPSKSVNAADVIGLIQAWFLNNERSS